MKNQTRKNQKANKTSNQVRIIGGQHKRRMISFIEADGLRPTPDRVRETVFNWLMGHIQDASVLDVCAGSGVLAIECLSRGAKSATLIEYQPAQAKLIAQNLQLLRLDTQAQVYTGDALDILPALKQPYDLIFIDPPYSANLWQKLIDAIFAHDLLHADSLIYLESDQELSQIITCNRLTTIKSIKAGQVYSYLLQVEQNC